MWNLVEGTWSTIGATAFHPPPHHHPHHPHLSSVFCTVVVLKARMLFGGIRSCRSLFIGRIEDNIQYIMKLNVSLSPSVGLDCQILGLGPLIRLWKQVFSFICTCLQSNHRHHHHRHDHHHHHQGPLIGLQCFRQLCAT